MGNRELDDQSNMVTLPVPVLTPGRCLRRYCANEMTLVLSAVVVGLSSQIGS
jgi:hypothetical protein